jgi:hypothetical protein
MDILGLIRKSLAGLGPASTRAPAAGERGLTALQDIGLNRFGQQRAEVPQDPLAALRMPELQARVAIEKEYPQLAPEAKNQLMQALVSRALRLETSAASNKVEDLLAQRNEVRGPLLAEHRARTASMYDELDTLPAYPIPYAHHNAIGKLRALDANFLSKAHKLDKEAWATNAKIAPLADAHLKYLEGLQAPSPEVQTILKALGIGRWP